MALVWIDVMTSLWKKQPHKEKCKQLISTNVYLDIHSWCLKFGKWERLLWEKEIYYHMSQCSLFVLQNAWHLLLSV